MENIILSTAGTTQAIKYTTQYLTQYGYNFSNKNATHILLDVPSKELTPSGISENVVIIGGNLKLPQTTIDLLQDPQYLAENAMITAHCAIKVALNNTERILLDQNILVIGWGRIGKCLAQLLTGMNCRVTVAARKEADRAILTALGFNTISIDLIIADNYGLIFNTVPELLIENCTAPATIIDLASQSGITGEHVITARGLPNKDAPASSGKLIADTVHRLLNRKE